MSHKIFIFAINCFIAGWRDGGTNCSNTPPMPFNSKTLRRFATKLPILAIKFLVLFIRGSNTPANSILALSTKLLIIPCVVFEACSNTGPKRSLIPSTNALIATSARIFP